MIGEMFRDARRQKGLSQLEVGVAVGISATQIGAIERGRYAPSPRTALLIASYLGYPEGWVNGWLRDESRLHTRIHFTKLLIGERRLVDARIILRQAWFQDVQKYAGRYRPELCHAAGQLAYYQGRYRVATQWFGRMGHRLPHASTKTRGIVAYDRGMALLRARRLSEAYHWLTMAYDYFASSQNHRTWQGYARWGMAACLFDAHHYPQAFRHYQQAVEAFPHGEVPPAVRLGLTLCQWIVRPTPETEAALVNLDIPSSDILTFAFWCLAVAILRRQQGALDEALKSLSWIPSNIPPEVYAELRAEQVICYWEIGDVKLAQRYLTDMDVIIAQASEDLRLFYWTMTHLIERTGPIAVPPCDEGYEQRLASLRHVILPSVPVEESST